MINSDEQLSWIMGLVPSMDERFVAEHYSDLLSIASNKLDKQKGNENMEKIIGKVFSANYSWDLPYVRFIVKKKFFVNDSAKEKCDAVSAKIDEYLAENNKPSFDELEKLIDKYPYPTKKNVGDAGYPNEITFYSAITIYLYAEDLNQIIEE